MAKAHGYSIWLMPTGNLYYILANLMSKLSKKYSTPMFEPHVTLIGELCGSKEDIIYKTSQLANIMKPFRITLEEVEYFNEYFKRLYIRVRETDDIIGANLKARRIFNVSNCSKYTPHLSLMYDDFPHGTKNSILAEIGKGFESSFDVRSIHLFSTNGEPIDWYKVEDFSFK